MTTLSYARPRRVAADVERPHLFVVMGCGQADFVASRHALHDLDEVVVGRGSAPGATRATERGRRRLRLSIPDVRVSTAHARIERDAATFRATDLGSKNGTIVDGVAASGARLEDGSLIVVGETLLIFRAALPTPPDARTDYQASAGGPFATLIPSFARDLDDLVAAASANLPILLTSETGTGKEVVARAIHALARPNGPFVALNCAALPATLTESVLFGHRRGAFSGATSDAEGLFRAADGGTLLLDEIGDMPLALQAALLRALETGEVLPVGATKPVRSDARIIAATNADIEERVARGAFREDLQARLAGFVFRLPPLRERREDLGLLAGALLRRIGEERGRVPMISAEAAALLFRYAWPRNIRELDKCLLRAAVLAADGRIEPEHLSAEVRAGARGRARGMERRGGEEETRGRLLRLLVEHRGNLAAVAEAMGTSRSQVHRWLKRFAIDPVAYRA